MDIQGKVALVTGSAKRIGRETAVELARRGGIVAIHYRTSEREAVETLRMVSDSGGRAELFRADLANTDDIQGMFSRISAAFGGLDILVNSASVFGAGSADQTTPVLWDEQMDTNVKGPFFVAQCAARIMLARGHGKIINVVDVAGEVVWPTYLAYSVSKAALIAVNRGLAKSYAPEIQVNAVAPGPILFPENYTEEQKRLAIERTLLKRQGSPRDVVNAIVFLIENDYITGEIIHMDGGRHIM